MENPFRSADEQLLDSGLFADVVVKCGERTWKLHKNILCTRSKWFDAALNGNFAEANSREISLSDEHGEDAVDWVIRYVYTGVCDIPTLRPGTKTNFVTCYEVYTVADYFGLPALVRIALDALAAEFDARLPRLQLQGERPDYLDELFDAIELVYQHVPVPDTNRPHSPLRAAFLGFSFAARFVLVNIPAFRSFVRSSPAAAAFFLDMSLAGLDAGDYVAQLPEAHCTICRNKPALPRADKAYFTHVAPQKSHLLTACSNCAVKKGLPPPMQDWSGKNPETEGAAAVAAAADDGVPSTGGG
ncbi:BTB/POZ protein [Apodospora peruviana]|uniref:BTB/POZ protein n=1 Tax=Apodospora peruviana TaxID=516989 RepID=A0AAE0HWG1_9PEZI|nr:BTB/POZ protein [Apodospora peruviana]